MKCSLTQNGFEAIKEGNREILIIIFTARGEMEKVDAPECCH